MKQEPWFVKFFFVVTIMLVFMTLTELSLWGAFLIISKFWKIDLIYSLGTIILNGSLFFALIGVILGIGLYKKKSVYYEILKLKQTNYWFLVIAVAILFIVVFLELIGSSWWFLPRLILVLILEMYPFFALLSYQRHSNIKVKANILILIILLNPLFVLGINTADIWLNYQHSFQQSYCGINVTYVEPIGPAAIAGLQTGNIITKLNNEEIKDVNIFNEKMSRLDLNVPVAFEIKEGNKFNILPENDGKGNFRFGFNITQAICK